MYLIPGIAAQQDCVRLSVYRDQIDCDIVGAGSPLQKFLLRYCVMSSIISNSRIFITYETVYMGIPYKSTKVRPYDTFRNTI